MKISVKPLTTKTWNDFTELFGERGVCGGCWCMAWRLKSSDFNRLKGSGNKKNIKRLVDNKEQIGLLTYNGKEPIGCCAKRKIYSPGKL